ncbi:MAG: PH domain-containing protein [Actinobacteria bacterium]|nr:PH domain-containing protein [Actinomycetota bacterium]
MTAGRDRRHAADPTGAEPAVGGEWRRLSRRMLLVHPVQELVRLAPALIGIVLAGHRNGQGVAWGLAATGVAVLVGALRWFTTTYRVTGDQVQVRRGLLRRRLLVAPLDRVRTVDLSAGALHRVLRLERVTLGTGAAVGAGHEGLRLDALDAAAAARLREELVRRRQAATGTAVMAAPGLDHAVGPQRAAEVTLAAVRPSWLRFGPFTLSGLVAVGVVTGLLSRVTSEAEVDLSRYRPLHAVATHLGAAPLWRAVVEVALAFVVVVALVSTAGYLLAFGGYRLTRHSGGTLHVVRGLIARRAVTIELSRVRGVEISEPMLLRIVGGARCSAVTTGLRTGHDSSDTAAMLLPPAPRADADRVAAAVLGTDRPVTTPLARHGRRARQRRYGRALLPCVLGAVALLPLGRLVAGPAGAWLLGVVAMPFVAVLAWDRYRNLGHAVVGEYLVRSAGSLVRRRTMLSREGIVGWTVRESFFQRRAGLATLTATTAAGAQHYAVPDVELGTAVCVADALLPGLLTPFLLDSPGPR